MWLKIVKNGLSDDYERKSRRISSLLIAAGVITSVYTLFSTVGFSTILGVALTAVGTLSAYLTQTMNRESAASWIKTMLLLFCGLLFLFSGLSGTPSVALVIGIFFVLSTLDNLYFAYLTRQNSTAFAWLANALATALFAYLILSNTETISTIGIGLSVALSLIADGLTVLYSGRTIFIRP